MSQNAHLAEADPELAALLTKLPRTEPPSDINVRRKIFNEVALPKVQACYKADAPDGTSQRVNLLEIPMLIGPYDRI